MEEAFVPLCLFRRLRLRKERNESCSQLRRVHHLSLGGTRMNGNPREGYPGSGGVKGLAFKPTDIAPVDRETVRRAESRHINRIRTPSDFLIRCEKNPDFSVRIIRMSEEPLRGIHDRGNPGFVVRAEKRAAVGADDVFTDMAPEFREYFRIKTDFVFRVECDRVSVPGFRHLRMNALTGGFR